MSDEAKPSRVATRHQVESFARWLASQSPHADDCWHCDGRGRVRGITSGKKRCSVCNGTGKDPCAASVADRAPKSTQNEPEENASCVHSS